MTNQRRFLILAAVAAVTVIVDQVTKLWALASLEPGQSHPLLGEALQLRLIFNPGAAFSFLTGHTWVFTLIACAMTIAVPILARRINDPRILGCVGLFWGGTIGNLIDRLIQPPAFGSGMVIDFLDYGGFFVGNIADIALVVAVIGLVVMSLKAGADNA